MQAVLPTAAFPISSPWHQMDARWKLLGVVLALATVPWLHEYEVALAALLGSILLLLTAKVPIRWWWDRFLTVGVFVLLFVLVLPFTLGGPSWHWGGIYLSERGTHLALMILLKSLTAVCLTLFLLGTTSMEMLLHAATQLGIPRPILRVLMITWRYVRIMYDTIEHFRIALRLRGFRNRTGWRTYGTIANVAGTMFVQGFEHTERVSQAMRLRGYHGRVETLEVFQTRTKDILLFSAIFLCCGILLLMSAL